MAPCTASGGAPMRGPRPGRRASRFGTRHPTAIHRLVSIGSGSLLAGYQRLTSRPAKSTSYAARQPLRRASRRWHEAGEPRAAGCRCDARDRRVVVRRHGRKPEQRAVVRHRVPGAGWSQSTHHRRRDQPARRAASVVNEEGGGYPSPAPLRGGRNAAHRLRASPPHLTPFHREARNLAREATTGASRGGCHGPPATKSPRIDLMPSPAREGSSPAPDDEQVNTGGLPGPDNSD